MRSFNVQFERDRCKGCSLCVSVCPKKILQLDESTINSKGYNPAMCIDITKCIGCLSCAMMCPDSVIEIEELI